ncbi:MAG: hypothetical protein GY765_24330, partial [bacterium]|nr:hypothetical protein [bacterium]
NGKTVFAYKKARNLEERIYQVFGKEFLDTLREIDHDSDRYHVKGFVSKLNTGVSVKKHQYFYVNGRSVREKTLIAALNNTFSNYLEKYRYPVGILLFTIPPHEVDVNIHPMKLEIKFENSGFIYQFIKQAIDRSLAGSYDGSGGFSATGGGGNYPDQAPGGPGGPIRSGGFDRPAFGGGGGLRYHGDSQQTQADYEQTHLFSGNFLNEEDFILIGQYKNSYILVERNEELLIVDQHNAQERVNFDRLKKEYQAGGVTSITPLFPIIVNLSTSEVHQMEEKHDALEKLGFRIEALSGNSFDIKAFPQILEEKSIKDALLEILHLQERKDFEDELLAEVACKSAIKVNHKLYPDQMKTIVKNLFETSNPYFCPHKRPIIIDFSLEKIEKMLKRR